MKVFVFIEHRLILYDKVGELGNIYYETEALGHLNGSIRESVILML